MPTLVIDVLGPAWLQKITVICLLSDIGFVCTSVHTLCYNLLGLPLRNPQTPKSALGEVPARSGGAREGAPESAWEVAWEGGRESACPPFLAPEK